MAQPLRNNVNMSDYDPNEIAQLRNEVAAMRTDIKDLVDAWKAAQGAVKVFRVIGHVSKWMVAVGAPIAFLIAWAKGGK